MDFLTLVIVASLIPMTTALLVSVGSMPRGGEFDDKHSELLMFAKVGKQTITLLLLFVVLHVVNT